MARARKLAGRDRSLAKIGATSRNRAARHGPAIAPRFGAWGTERKRRAEKNPGCGTSVAKWRGRGRDWDLSEAAQHFPKSAAPRSASAAHRCARPDCSGCTARRKRAGNKDYTAQRTEAAAVPNPIVTLIMGLLPSPAMADDRIEQTERTPAKNHSCSARPVES